MGYNRGMTRLETWRARFGATALGCAVALTLLMVLDPWQQVLSVTSVTLDDPGTKGAIFSALIAVAGLFLTVLLGMLGIVTNMDDDKPVIRIMKQEMRNYEELVHRLVGPVFSLLILVIASMVCLMMPSLALDKLSDVQIDAARAARRWMTIAPSFAVSLSIGLFIQTAMTARLLASVLLFRPRTHSPSDTHAASVARVRERREATAEPAAERDDTADAMSFAPG